MQQSSEEVIHVSLRGPLPRSQPSRSYQPSSRIVNLSCRKPSQGIYLEKFPWGFEPASPSPGQILLPERSHPQTTVSSVNNRAVVYDISAHALLNFNPVRPP